MKKNDIVVVEIEDMGHGGEGIGKVDGYPLFIKDGVIGDQLEVIVTKAGKKFGYGRIKQILRPSSFRVEPRCPIAGPCGGCQLQAMDYKKQLEFKENMIRNNLMRIGGFSEIPMEPIIGMEEPFHYRNKAQFPVGKNKDGKIITGFYAGRTHRIVENRRCCLGVSVNEKILDQVIAYMEENGVEPYNEETGKGIVRHVLIRYGFFSREIMVCVVVNADQLPKKDRLIEKLTGIEGMTSISISVNKKNTNVIMGDTVKLLWGQPYITDSIGEISYQISPLSFYQVNPIQTRKLYETALAYADLHGDETVWDLYCGIGTISLFLAQKAGMVYGVEIVPDAIADAKRNAELNSITNARFYVGRAEEVLPEKYRSENIKADVMVIDPPRKGCDSRVLETMVSMAPEKIVYVSCDSATLARDLKYLCENGYELKKVRGVDLFGQSVHVETVCLLSKLNTKQHIEIEVDMDELDLTSAESKATYEEIKDWVKENYGFNVSTLNIAKTKEKCGILERECYNKPKNENSRQPNATKEKEDAIIEAFKHFQMISE